MVTPLAKKSPATQLHIPMDATELKRREGVVREEVYQTLFNSMDQGYCVIEVLFDADGHAEDYRFLDVNPAFEKHTGLKEATGKRIRELAPDHESHWFETYGKVALTGEPVRFVNEAKALDDRWFDVYAFRLGDPQDRRIAVLFSDITERTRTEIALRSHAEELTRFNEVAVGRELRMIELKKEINQLSEQLGRLAPYPLEFERDEVDRKTSVGHASQSRVNGEREN